MSLTQSRICPTPPFFLNTPLWGRIYIFTSCTFTLQMEEIVGMGQSLISYCDGPRVVYPITIFFSSFPIKESSVNLRPNQPNHRRFLTDTRDVYCLKECLFVLTYFVCIYYTQNVEFSMKGRR